MPGYLNQVYPTDQERALLNSQAGGSESGFRGDTLRLGEGMLTVNGRVAPAAPPITGSELARDGYLQKVRNMLSLACDGQGISPTVKRKPDDVSVQMEKQLQKNGVAANLLKLLEEEGRRAGVDFSDVRFRYDLTWDRQKKEGVLRCDMEVCELTTENGKKKVALDSSASTSARRPLLTLKQAFKITTPGSDKKLHFDLQSLPVIAKVEDARVTALMPGLRHAPTQAENDKNIVCGVKSAFKRPNASVRFAKWCERNEKLAKFLNVITLGVAGAVRQRGRDAIKSDEAGVVPLAASSSSQAEVPAISHALDCSATAKPAQGLHAASQTLQKQDNPVFRQKATPVNLNRVSPPVQSKEDEGEGSGDGKQGPRM